MYFNHIRYKPWHHRWFFRKSNIEVSFGPALALEVQVGCASDDDETIQIYLGLVFLKIFWTFPGPDWFFDKEKHIATWDNNREFYLVVGRNYGFSFHHWTLWWKWRAKVNESSSKDPKWMRFSLNFPDLIFGKTIYFSDTIWEDRDVYFSIDGQEFKIDEIKWEKNTWFRSRIPHSLYRVVRYFGSITINKPPKFSGKGENSWDCRDDGIFGCSLVFDEPYRFDRRDEFCEIAARGYFDRVIRNVKRYGSAKDGPSPKAEFKYIGRKTKENQCDQAAKTEPLGSEQWNTIAAKKR